MDAPDLDDYTYSYEDLSTMHRGYLTAGCMATDGIVPDRSDEYRPSVIENAKALLDARKDMLYFTDLAVKDLTAKGVPITYDNLADAFILQAKDSREDGRYNDYLKLGQYATIMKLMTSHDEFSCCGYFPIYILHSLMGRAEREINGALALVDPDRIYLRLERLSCGYEFPMRGYGQEPDMPLDDEFVTLLIATFPEHDVVPYSVSPSFTVVSGKYSELVDEYDASYRPYVYLDESPSGKSYILGVAGEDVSFLMDLLRFVSEHVLDIIEDHEVDGDWLLDLAYQYYEEN